VIEVIVASTLITLAVGLAIRHHHFLFAVALAMVGAYELSAPVLIAFLDDATLVPALAIFQEQASTEAVETFTRGLLAFFAFFVGAYIVAGPGKTSVASSVKANAGSGNEPRVFIPVILVFGIISVVTGAGQSRLEDYVGELNPTTRFFSYGALLFVVCGAILWHQLFWKKWSAFVVTALCFLPLTIELFIAGKRQWFAPAAFILLMLILYSRVRYKLAFAAASIFVVTAFFALQYSLREQIQQADSELGTAPFVWAILIPQMNEFLGVGAISFYSWNMFVLEGTSPTWGLHWGFHLLNAFPFIKLGDMLFPAYSQQIYTTYSNVAPWGALSMVADAIIGFGWLGVPLLGIALGALCRKAHEYLVVAMQRGMPGDAKSIYTLSLIAVLFLKYRSGIGDAIQAAVAFSILYWTIVLVARLSFTSDLRVARRPAP
jgi:hypothetical protein